MHWAAERGSLMVCVHGTVSNMLLASLKGLLLSISLLECAAPRHGPPARLDASVDANLRRLASRRWSTLLSTPCVP